MQCKCCVGSKWTGTKIWKLLKLGKDEPSHEFGFQFKEKTLQRKNGLSTHTPNGNDTTEGLLNYWVSRTWAEHTGKS